MGPHTVAHQLFAAHRVAGRPLPAEAIALCVEQTLLHDATGHAVMRELEAMHLPRARTELSVQYVDHDALADDEAEASLRSAAARFGMWFSPAGNGVSHTLHQRHFGAPGKLLVGADEHTPAAGALGMLALAARGIEVARAIAGEPVWLRMPEVWGVELVGRLPPWVSAKDVILELLRRHGPEGAKGRVIEYFGRGVATLSVTDRHVIAAMGTELGATTSVFPSDDVVRRFLAAEGRGRHWIRIEADLDAQYDALEHVDLSQLQPLVAMPDGIVRPVTEVVGEPIGHAYVGSTGNPGFRDFAIAAEIVRGQRIAPDVAFDVSPTSHRLLGELARSGHLDALLQAGARIRHTGCEGWIDAPSTEALSLCTIPSTRSGKRPDATCLVSPETAAASALAGCITDPRTLGVAIPQLRAPERRARLVEPLVPPPPVYTPRTPERRHASCTRLEP